MADAEWPLDVLDVTRLIDSGWRPIPFREIVLKVHGRCNLACDYCYIYQMADQTWQSRPTAMAWETMTVACRRIAEHAIHHGLDRIRVILHGGEPLLVGADMLGRIAQTLNEALSGHTVVDYVAQTNAVLLSRDMLKALDRYDIKVGVSFDGDRQSHDRHRRFVSGRGSYEAVTRALQLLSSESYRHLFTGLLCVVDLDTDPVATYEALVEFKPPRIDFLLPHGNWEQPPPRLALDGARTPYGDWLVAAFDRWYDAVHLETEVRLFSEIIQLLLGGVSRCEEIGISPVAIIVIDTDGSLEQVDTLRSAYHGAATTNFNIHSHPLDAALLHPAVVARQIGLAALGATCQGCDIRHICGGGYYPHRYRKGSGFRERSVYCHDLSRLIRHIYRRLRHDVAQFQAYITDPVSAPTSTDRDG